MVINLYFGNAFSCSLRNIFTYLYMDYAFNLTWQRDSRKRNPIKLIDAMRVYKFKLWCISLCNSFSVKKKPGQRSKKRWIHNRSICYSVSEYTTQLCTIHQWNVFWLKSILKKFVVGIALYLLSKFLLIQTNSILLLYGLPSFQWRALCFSVVFFFSSETFLNAVTSWF